MLNSPREKRKAEKTAQAETALDKWMVGSTREVDAVATCYDPRYPVLNILDGSHDTFWVSTGMFPQEIVVGFREEVKLSEIKTTTRNVRGLTISRIVPAQASVGGSGRPAWKEVVTKELLDTKNKMQVDINTINNIAVRFLRFTILSAYDHFVAFYSLRVQTSDGKWLC